MPFWLKRELSSPSTYSYQPRSASATMATQSTDPWQKQSPRGEERPSMPQRKAMFLRRSSHPWMRQYPRDDMPRTKVTYPRGAAATRLTQESQTNPEEANEGRLNPRRTTRAQQWQATRRKDEEAKEGSLEPRSANAKPEDSLNPRSPEGISERTAERPSSIIRDTRGQEKHNPMIIDHHMKPRYIIEGVPTW